MSTRKVKAGEAYVELTAKDKMAAGLKRAEAQLKSFAVAAEAIGQSIAAVGAGLMAGGTAILGALSGAAKVFADTGSAVQDLANRTGLATDHLSELQYAAEQTGASVGALEAGLRTMIKQGMKPGDFDAIAARLANIADPAERAAEAMKVFGKSGMQLLPMLGELQALRGQARDLGLSISPESAARADALGDAFDNLLRVGKDLAYELGDAIAEPLTRIIQASTQAAVAVSGFVANNQALIAGIAGLAVAATAAGAVMVGFGTALMGVAVASQLLVATYAALAAPFVLVGAGVALVAAALLTAAASWVIFSEAGQAAVAATAGVVKHLLNAVAKGNLTNAFAQMAAGVRIVWEGLAASITNAFYTAAQNIVKAMHTALATVSGALIAAEISTGRDLGSEGVLDAQRALTGAGATIDTMKNSALAAHQAKIVGLQNELDALRNLVAPEAAASAVSAARRFAFTGIDLSTALGGGAGGASAGTFSAAGAGLLGRSAPALEREAKEQTGLLKGIKDVLSDIDDGIDELEGFAMG